MPKPFEKTLRGIQLFVNLPPEEIVSLETRCKWAHYAAGEQILDRDSDNRDVYFVVGGSVRIVNFSTSGREIALATIEAGSFSANSRPSTDSAARRMSWRSPNATSRRSRRPSSAVSS